MRDRKSSSDRTWKGDVHTRLLTSLMSVKSVKSVKSLESLEFCVRRGFPANGCCNNTARKRHSVATPNRSIVDVFKVDTGSRVHG